jgi:glycosyltransferase involved in cell wall biosynthesis
VRALIVTQSYWPELGGAQVMLRRLAHEFVRLGHDVTVLTCRWNDEPLAEIDSGVRIVRLPFLKARWVGTLRHMAQVTSWVEKSGRSFDIVYGSMLKHTSWAALKSAALLGRPVVLRAEGAGATGDVAWQTKALMGMRIRNACRRADAIIAPGRAIEAELLEAGYPADRVRFLPNGVPVPDEPWRRADTARWRHELGLPDRPTVIYTGRLSPEKSLTTLIDALADPGPAASTLAPQLLLLGDGPERAILEERASRAGLGDRLLLPGSVPAVEPWLRAAELFALPSRHEGMSLSLLEALAFGMPALASDIAPNRDLLDDAPLEFAPVGDVPAWRLALGRLLGDRDGDQLRFGTRTQVADRYGITTIARRHLELFEKLIGG